MERFALMEGRFMALVKEN